MRLTSKESLNSTKVKEVNKKTNLEEVKSKLIQLYERNNKRAEKKEKNYALKDLPALTGVKRKRVNNSPH